MLARHPRERGQATVEHLGLVVLVATLLVVVTSLLVRSLHPPARAPELVARLADRLVAPLADGPPASSPASVDPGPAPGAPSLDALPAEWPPVAAEPPQPFWIALDLHHRERPIGRWLRSAGRAALRRLPAAGVGCVQGAMSMEMPRGAATALAGRVRLRGPLPAVGDDITGLVGAAGIERALARLPGGRLLKGAMKARRAIGACLVGAAEGLLSG